MNIELGVNTGFALNRFPEHDDWLSIVSDELGLSLIQFTADILNPFLPEDVVARGVDQIRDLCAKKGVRVHSTFSGAFTRVNHLLHPDPVIRRVWLDWFRKFFKMTAELGGEGSGSCFGLMSVRDNNDPETRERRIQQGVDAWRELSYTAGELGLEYVMFEPMSVPRECGETIAATQDLLDRCREGFAVPMGLCQDVDHGDLESPDPCDTNPHAWIRAFPEATRCIHIKQSLKDKGGHYPFTEEYNARGTIVPEEILATMRNAGLTSCPLIFELSHRERWPTEYTVVADLKASVAYWRPVVEAANAEG